MIWPDNPYAHVLQSYVRRPLFTLLARLLVLYVILEMVWLQARAGDYSHEPYFRMARGEEIAIEAVLGLLFLLLPIGCAAAIAAHLRAQLQTWRSILVPDYPRPHWAVAAIIFFGIALLIPGIYVGGFYFSECYAAGSLASQYQHFFLSAHWP